MIDRRRMLFGGAASALALGVGGRFGRAAAAPGLAEGDPFVLEARRGRHRLAGADKGEADLWLYNGTSPGPVIRARQGEEVHVRLVNRLDEPTSVHWHGVRIDNSMDGVPGLTQEAVAPGASFDYRFRVPDAGTYWYHTHERAWEQMARGLYGVLIVEEPAAPDFDRDLPLVLDDWRLDENGRLEDASFGNVGEWAHAGRYGNWLTLNGGSEPEIAVASGERVRLRLINTCNARILKIGLEDAPAWVVALDGHPVAPRPLGEAIELAPAQRADIALDIGWAAGERRRIVEVSTGETVEAGALVAGEGTGRRRTGEVAGLPHSMPHAGFRPEGARRVALSMTGGAMGGPMANVRHMGRMMDMRELVQAGRVWAMNGVAGDLDEPLVSARRGETVMIEVDNDTAWPHAMHLHGHHFQVIEIDGRPVADPDWRDTHLMAPRERASFAFLADNPGKWLFHCHMLEHHAGGMATYVEVA